MSIVFDVLNPLEFSYTDDITLSMVPARVMALEQTIAANDGLAILRTMPARLVVDPTSADAYLTTLPARVLATESSYDIALLKAPQARVVAHDIAIAPSVDVALLITRIPVLLVQDIALDSDDMSVTTLSARVVASEEEDITICRPAPARIYALEAIPPLVNYAVSIQSPGYMYLSSGAYAALVDELVSLSWSGSSRPIYVASDAVALIGIGSGGIEATNAVIDDIALLDSLGIIWSMFASDALGVGSTALPSAIMLSEAIDTLSLLTGTGNLLDATNAVAMAIALNDALAVIVPESITDQAQFNAVLSSALTAALTTVDTLQVQALASETAMLSAIVSEAFLINDPISSLLDAISSVSDGIGLTIRIRFGDDTFIGWVVNTENKAVSTYSNFPFNSFAKIGERYFGATDNGIYALDADDDDGDPINARIRTGLFNLGTGKMKRMPAMYLGYVASGKLVLKVITTSPSGEKVENWYELGAQTANAVREGRIKIGRGLKSVYWGFELTNVSGADFALDVVELFPLILDRRI